MSGSEFHEDGEGAGGWDFSSSSLRGLWRVGQALARQFMTPPDRLREIETELALIRLQRERGIALPVGVEFDSLVKSCGPRADHIIVGDRGGGKSALAFRLVQRWAELFDVRPCAVGLPDWVCERMGLQPVRDLQAVPLDAVVLVDEAGIQLLGASKKRREGLRGELAVARHRGISWVWVAQSLSAVDREVLRSEAVIWCKAFDVFRARFDREELAEWLQTLACVQAAVGMEDKRVCTVSSGGRWYVTENSLPDGWDEGVSRCWRRAGRE